MRLNRPQLLLETHIHGLHWQVMAALVEKSAAALFQLR